MNATPLITRLLAALDAQHLEAVLIGNAAAAIHGAPVTTLDFEFMFRETPTNMRKLKRVATDLGAESRRQLQDLIRRRLALPIEERMNFLRRRLPGGGSCL